MTVTRLLVDGHHVSDRHDQAGFRRKFEHTTARLLLIALLKEDSLTYTTRYSRLSPQRIGRLPLNCCQHGPVELAELCGEVKYVLRGGFTSVIGICRRLLGRMLLLAPTHISSDPNLAVAVNCSVLALWGRHKY